jgi:short-subunit dehydrogenase
MPGMLAQRRGVFVHVGSPASVVPWPGATAYTSSRWALRGLHEALRQDLRGTGLHTSHVMFGPVASGYWDNNPGTFEAAPRIGLRLLRTLEPPECGAVVLDVIRRPRPEVLHPPLLRALRWFPHPVRRWTVAQSSPVRRA